MMTGDEEISDDILDVIAAMRVCGGSGIATRSDLAWAVHADARTLLAVHARDPHAYPGPWDRAFQLSTYRFVSGGLRSYGESPAFTAIVSWYAGLVMETLLGTKSRIAADEPVTPTESAVLAGANLTTRLAFGEGNRVVVDPNEGGDAYL